ncbi:MAG TPA: 6-bladed beta-propeller [Longimicrobiales bacterium]
MRHALFTVAVLSGLVGAACGSSAGRGGAGWLGTIDTLPSGQVVVANPADPIWPEGGEWRVIEELRIGSVTGDGADVFGRINGLAVDPAGRMWVFDSQAQELRVFDATGAHVRTVGRRGGGPGEFAQAVRVELGPDGNIWVMDPQNNRLSVFDTAGVYLEGKPALGGFIILPWPGRFDARGRYYAPVPVTGRDGFHMDMVRYDTAFTPMDTLRPPDDPVEREGFELRSERGHIVAGVPFQGRLTWRISPAGTIWALITDQYRLFEVGPDGDTLRTITRAFEPIPVTAADLEQAREDLKWFTDQGGRVDWSKIPDTKPPVQTFFFDDEDDIWVERVTSSDMRGRVFDVFDPVGRYLGAVRLPFALTTSPPPVVRDGVLYGVTRDELDVAYVVRARIVKPEAA